MTTSSNVKSYSLPGFFVFSSILDRFLAWLRCTLPMSLLVSFIWLSVLSVHPAVAETIAVTSLPERITMQEVDFTAEADRMSALIACLPKQLSQPNLKRALSEMGNDQLERAFNLKANPKLSQAEVDLANCLSRRES